MVRDLSKAVLFVCLLNLISFSIIGQRKELSIDQMLDNKMPLIILPSSNITWSENDEVIYSKQAMHDTAQKFYSYDLKNNHETGLAANYKIQTPISAKVFIKDNDIYFSDEHNFEVKLTANKNKIENPTLSPDKKRVAFTRNNNLFVIEIASKKEIQLTNDGNDSIMNGYASWVYTEEILGRASTYRTFWWSPDSRRIAFFRTDDSPVPVYTITDGNGQHGLVEKERYPKVGDSNPEIKIGIIDLNTNHITWAAFNEKDDQYFGMPYWTPDGSALWVQWMNRLQNNLKIYSVEPNSGAKKEIYDETQITWIQLADGFERLHFLDDNSGFVLESDKTGWNQLYHYDMNGTFINQITLGKFTVTGVIKIDLKNKIVFFTARKENSARIDFYSVKINGQDFRRLTSGDFNNVIQISPSGKYFISTYNNTTTPTRAAVFNINGKLIHEVYNSKGPEFDNYAIAKTELVRIKSDDGLFELPAQITWPLNMDTNKKYPVLISIYGGPNAGTVMDRWVFNGMQQWYAKEGIIQVNMDHRASGHFGKEGVNYMYHKLGYWEMKDYSTIVKYLISKGSADSKKICITGFSYGGFMTCYALTYGADLFTHGMAGGSVTDWTFYDTHYTERYMGTPANNPEGYKNSSVLNYADKYKGILQIVHGVIDDNVHIQNSLRLISLLEDKKKEFEFMLYPGGRHGWPGNKRIHFQNLKNRFIYRYLLDKPMPEGVLK